MHLPLLISAVSMSLASFCPFICAGLPCALNSRSSLLEGIDPRGDPSKYPGGSGFSQATFHWLTDTSDPLQIMPRAGKHRGQPGSLGAWVRPLVSFGTSCL